jgi:cytochrome P450
MPDEADATTNPLTWAHSDLARAPQPTYQALRETSPALRVDGVGVLVTTRAMVDEVLRHPDTFSSALTSGHLKTERPLIPLEVDPPDHRKFRKLLDPLFAPRRMQQLEPSIAALVDRLIDGFGDAREIDFTTRFSVPFPSQVFLTLLGLPLDDLSTLLAMKDGIIRPHLVVGQPLGHPDVDAHQAATARSIYEYFERLVDERGGDRPDDHLSYLLDAEVEGERLTHEEILDICALLLVAGLDTVSASLDCFFVYLAEHPDRRREIVQDPTLIPAVVEELLRWETPVMIVPRVAARGATLGETEIEEGDRVMVMLGAANTDDAEFGDAATVRWDREANRHLGFGGGVHRCLGSHLARAELRVALRVWHERIPDYAIKPGVELAFANGVRALDTLPLILGTA